MSAEQADAARRPRRKRVSFAEETAGSAPPPGSDAWRRVHKLTPVLNIWHVLVVLIGVVAVNIVQSLGDIPGIWDAVASAWVLVLLGALAAIVVVLVVTALYSTLAWKQMRYAIDDRAVYFHQGILTKQQRVARLNRIQAVDVVQPLLGRIFGLARVVVETAGGGDSQVEIQYLKREEANRVRREILTRATHQDVPGAAATGPDGAVTPEGAAGGPGDGSARPGGGFDAAARPGLEGAERERLVYQVDPGRLIASAFLDTGVIASLLGMVLLVVGFVIMPMTFAALLALLPGFLALGGYVFGRISGEWGLKARVAPEGIRLRRGLLQTTSQTLPAGRIQAVRLHQGVVWRLFGWWRVQVNVAGYGDASEDKGNQTQTVLLPVGDRDTALTAMWLVVADLGVDDARATIDAALAGSGTAAGFLTSPRRMRWLDPLTYRHNGLLLTRTATIVRRGRFTRTVLVVPHERLQSVAAQQGPIERRMRVADFVSHSVPGPIRDIRAGHLEAADVAAALAVQAERARTARAVEHTEDWAERVGVPGAAPETTDHRAPAPEYLGAPGPGSAEESDPGTVRGEAR